MEWDQYKAAMKVPEEEPTIPPEVTSNEMPKLDLEPQYSEDVESLTPLQRIQAKALQK